MNDKRINFTIIGKTGAGKSSLCNYIFQESVFETGVGRPVTGWDQHFKSHEVAFDGFTLNVFDSVGIEPNNLSEWKPRLEEFVSRKGPDHESNPADWIHVAIYAINGASARIEDAEIDLIRILRSQNIPVQVVLTNADQSSSDQLSAIQNAVRAEFDGVDISEVCSVSVKRRSGATSEPFGREEFLFKLIHSMGDALRPRLIGSMLMNMQEALKTAKREVTSAIQESDIGLFNLIKKAITEDNDFDLDDFIEADIDNRLEDAASQYEGLLESIETFIEQFPVDYEAKPSFFEVINSVMESVESAMNDASSKVEDYFSSVALDMETGSVWEKAKAFGRVAKVLFSIKSFLIQQVNEPIDAGIREIDLQISKLAKESGHGN